MFWCIEYVFLERMNETVVVVTESMSDVNFQTCMHVAGPIKRGVYVRVGCFECFVDDA